MQALQFAKRPASGSSRFKVQAGPCSDRFLEIIGQGYSARVQRRQGGRRGLPAPCYSTNWRISVGAQERKAARSGSQKDFRRIGGARPIRDFRTESAETSGSGGASTSIRCDLSGHGTVWRRSDLFWGSKEIRIEKAR